MSTTPVFQLLSEPLRKALLNAGISTPTPPQERVVPLILRGCDILLVAPTGTGKTEAVLLPVLNNFLAQADRQPVSILYITPMRALNRDMQKRLVFWSTHLGFKVDVRHGDTSQAERRKQLTSPPDMLVTTPETLQALLPSLRMRRHLANVRWVIVDEIHSLVENKRGAQLAVGLQRLRELTKSSFQVVGLSATISEPEKAAALIGGSDHTLRIVNVPLPRAARYFVEYPVPTEADYALSQSLYTTPEATARLSRIAELVDFHDSSLVFVNSRTVAETLGSKLNILRNDIAVHHGSLPKEERVRVENAFKQKDIKGLVCTSTLELGIDIGSADLSIQYMSPRQVATLIQRVGRSGHRIDRQPEGVILAVSSDDILESTVAVERAMQGQLESLTVPQTPLDVMAHQIAGNILDGKGSVSLDKVLYTFRTTLPFSVVNEQEVARVVEFMERLKLLRREGRTLRLTRRTNVYYYQNLSMIPDERRYPVIDLATHQTVGILGEEFVLLRARVGVTFIIKGKIWKVQQISDDAKVYVLPADDPLAAIPGWDGDMLPIPFELAQHVGRVRREIADMFNRQTPQAIIQDVLPWAERFAKKKVLDEIQEHIEMGAPVPSDKLILLESYQHYLIIHACFGEGVNQALGHILDEILSLEGKIRRWWSDGYRILVELTDPISRDDLEQLAGKISQMAPAEAKIIFHRRVNKQFPYPNHVKSIAERFGALRRGEYLAHGALCSLPARFAGTPIMDEALHEVETEKFDVTRMEQVIADINQETISVQIFESFEKPTPLGYHILNRYAEIPELIAPDTVAKDTVQRMKMALMHRLGDLICFTCGTRARLMMVKEVAEKPVCAKCGSGLLGVVSSQILIEALRKKLAGEVLSDNEKEVLARGRRSADLVLSYGRNALTALGVYGVGPQTAAKILAKMHDSEDEFFKDLLEAKLKFIVTRPFWDRA